MVEIVAVYDLTPQPRTINDIIDARTTTRQDARQDARQGRKTPRKGPVVTGKRSHAEVRVKRTAAVVSDLIGGGCSTRRAGRPRAGLCSRFTWTKTGWPRACRPTNGRLRCRYS